MAERIVDLTIEELHRIFYQFLAVAVPPDDTLKGRIWDAFIKEIRQECTIEVIE